ncbi:SEC14 cytosolic factor family protein [Musa troglodytarum]|uniref:SEC14 cytosolic factor family protein n=1 Tax=Musa troglodytarum TaxID=320322 RepID=A0A9E7K3T1_9LILI|nr:SEC14 cytosolic factor family protein [Musa troglodytarum]
MMGSTERKEPKARARVEEVLRALKKQAPLTAEQERFCSDACVDRFLRAKGDSVKKAAKHLRTVLSWRESIGTEFLLADEFSAELGDGMAYVAGHDDEARPVLVQYAPPTTPPPPHHHHHHLPTLLLLTNVPSLQVFRIKQDDLKLRSHKSFVRLLVFTLEVAISTMARLVDQLVLLFDASFFRSPKAFLNLFAGTLKIISDYYPGRLHKAFVIDPPSLFSCLWKGVRPFIDLSAVTAVVSSLDFEDSLEDAALASHPRTTSLRFHPSAAAAAAAKVAGSTSSRFSVTVSHLNSLKPWYLSTTTTSSVVVPTASPSLIGASPLSARSFSFASPAARSTPRVGISAGAAITRSIPSTPSSAAPTRPPPQQQHPRTPMPSFLQSPATLFSFKKERQLSRVDRERESFLPFLRFYRRPYDETAYRAKMRPPHGGLVSIVSLHDQPNKRRNKIQSFPFPSSQHRH